MACQADKMACKPFRRAWAWAATKIQAKPKQAILRRRKPFGQAKNVTLPSSSPHFALRTFSDLNSDDPAHISARDRSFMRALLHDDYLRMKTTILTDELGLMRATPGASLYVMFDYGTDPYGPCAVTIQPTSDLLEQFPCLEDYVVRAARSHGRMKLRVARGGNASIWMFPLRSATGEIAEGLDGMATDDEADTAGPVGLIQELVGRGIQEIHI
ncbi:hypothetical protein FB451DRAFT_1187840 [Mycena latifolia]|nr:hypothetical protein FB451DRAFT_1187840 [Mycena latifolia]